KSFEVLSYLVERAGRLVGKDELVQAVWRDVAVTDNSLSQCLVEIRRALGDDSQQIIRTVARRGYVFKASLTNPAAPFPIEPQPVQVAPKQRRRLWISLSIAVGLILLVGWTWLRFESSRTATDSLAVLPFK